MKQPCRIPRTKVSVRDSPKKSVPQKKKTYVLMLMVVSKKSIIIQSHHTLNYSYG